MSDVPEGYKRTEVGVIPGDWKIKELGEILHSTQLGGNYPNLEADNECPLIKMGNLNRGFIDLKKTYYIQSGIKPLEIDKVKFGDILFNTRNTLDLVGKVAIWRNELPTAFFNSNIMRLVFKKEEVSSNFFMNYIFNTRNSLYQLRGIATGTTSVAAIYTRDLVKIKVPIPPKSEQTAIATALYDADALISRLEELIAKKRDIKQGAMQELLKPKEGWKVKTLGDIAEIKDGTHQTPKYFDYGIPFYSVENVTANDFTNTKYISQKEHDFLTKNWKIEKGDILMTRIGSIGDCKYVDWDVNASFYVSLALLKVKKGYSAKFICQYSKCSFFKRELEMNSLLFAYPKKINLGQISKVKIVIPKPEEQIHISQILSDMDTEIEALIKKLEKYKAIKQGMMQELLTGKTRLV